MNTTDEVLDWIEAQGHRMAAQVDGLDDAQLRATPLPSGWSMLGLLAVWRALGLDVILRECWEAGVVLAGQNLGFTIATPVGLLVASVLAIGPTFDLGAWSRSRRRPSTIDSSTSMPTPITAMKPQRVLSPASDIGSALPDALAGEQRERYPDLNPNSLPLRRFEVDGEPATVEVDLAGTKVACQIWKADVGRVPLLLLDTDLPRNAPEDRNVTDKLYGGDVDIEQRFISPTLLGDIPDDAHIMHEEIFGPLLPIIRYQRDDEVIERINAGPKPLALYVWSRKKANALRLLRRTSAGGSCINQIALQFLQHRLPFGGVNHSGIGSYHGEWGIHAFSHARAVLQGKIQVAGALYPPYGSRVRRLAALLRRWSG